MLQMLIYDPSVVVGFVLILAVVWQWFTVPADTRQNEYILLVAIFTLVVTPAAQGVANWLSQVRPMKLDLYAYVADGYLGQPAFVLGRLVAPFALAKVVLNVAYGLLPIGVILTLSGHILRRSGDVSLTVWAFVINLVAAPLFYVLIPVCGPQFAFPMFPLDPGPVIPHVMRIDAAPNGIPSVHTSTTLLIVWFSRRNRAGATAAVVYLLLMVVATLASGQHYAVDLLAAVPYAAGVLWLAKRVASRVRVPNSERVSG